MGDMMLRRLAVDMFEAVALVAFLSLVAALAHGFSG